MAGQAAWLQGGWELGSILLPPIMCIPLGQGPCKVPLAPALPGLCPLLSCPSVSHKGYRKHKG